MPFSQNLSPKIQNQLAKKVLVPLVGISSVGKTAIMRAIVAKDGDFHRTVSFTTRPKRDDEEADTYRFLSNTQNERTKIMQQFERGELIQFAIHPTTSYLYGTALEDYKGMFNLLDVLSSEVANFQALGFASCQTIMIVSSPKDWQTRFDSRDFAKDEAAKRIAEGISSLRWGLDQAGGVRWVENKQNAINETVEHVIAIAKNKMHANDDHARQVGENLLQYLMRIPV